MVKTKQNNSGFSVIEVLVLIIVISLLGFAGWKVYKNYSQKTTNSNPSTSTSAISGNVPVKRWYWKQSIDFTKPDGWTLGESSTGLTDYTLTLASQDATYKYAGSIGGVVMTIITGAEFTISLNHTPNNVALSDFKNSDLGSKSYTKIIKTFTVHRTDAVEYISGGYEAGLMHYVTFINKNTSCTISMDEDFYKNSLYAKVFDDLVSSVVLK